MSAAPIGVYTIGSVCAAVAGVADDLFHLHPLRARKLSVFVANELVQGETFKVGDKTDAIEISPNKVLGYDYEAANNGVIPPLGRTGLAKDKIDKFAF